MSFAITETSWRMVNEGFDLDADEVLVEQLPDTLVQLRQSEILKGDALTQLGVRMLDAQSVIGPLQAGVDINEISDEDRACWLAWKRYLVALGKTPEREGWPERPDWPVLPKF